jgi:hypothetical protein
VSWPAGAGVFVRRTAASPAGPAAPDLVVRVSGCLFAGNVGRLVAAPYAGDGGGMLVKGFDQDNRYDVLVSDTVFEGNHNAQGAGLYVGRYAQGLVVRSRFLHNRAIMSGGGAFKGGRWPQCVGETARFEYCEFVGNEAGYDEQGQVSSDLGWGGAFGVRYYPRAEFVHCSFSDNRCGGILPRGDAIFHTAEGRDFVSDLQTCVIVNSVFYGDNGVDVQVRSDAGGFGAVTHSALAAGEFVCDGVVPTDMVTLERSPYLGPLDLRLRATAPVIDQATVLGLGPDLAGTPVPTGDAPDMGAYEYVTVSAVGDGGPPAAAPTLVAAPNPFNPRTTVSFRVAEAGRVSLACYDLAGRRVRRLLDAELPAGAHSSVWDGADDAGRGLASGVYLLRLGTPSGVTTGRVLLLK